MQILEGPVHVGNQLETAIKGTITHSKSNIQDRDVCWCNNFLAAILTAATVSGTAVPCSFLQIAITRNELQTPKLKL
jgi:hypothetical protein